jgi:hypothetical protein
MEEIIKNPNHNSNCYAMAHVDDKGKVTAVGDERGRQGGWFWFSKDTTTPEELKSEIMELDKEFTGFYDNVKEAAFSENL